jgi:hypothetical protein
MRMQPEPTITKPVDPPVRYVAGGWPGGTVQRLSEAEANSFATNSNNSGRSSPS